MVGNNVPDDLLETFLCLEMIRKFGEVYGRKAWEEVECYIGLDVDSYRNCLGQERSNLTRGTSYR